MELFGTSGIRRIVNQDLITLSFKVGLALGGVYGNVVVGSDTRTSGDVIKHSLVSGILAAGGKCDDAGTVPTPTLAWAARNYAAGAMITASHNPPEYNGIKLWNTDGSSFDSAQQEKMEALVLGGTAPLASWEKMKRCGTFNGAIQRHTARIRRDFPDKVKLKVVVDAGCGAASLVTPELLKELGCEVVALDCYPSGFFPRGIEPTEVNLTNLSKVVRACGADLGIAHDGDADRMMAVDERGRFVSGDKLLCLLARESGAQELVTTLDASMVIEEMGFPVRRTMVGDTYVSAELKQNGGDFGGETSGSWVFPAVSLCPDGIYAAALLARIAAKSSLAEMVDDLPSYPLLRGSVSSKGVALAEIEERLLSLKAESVSRIDGIRLNFRDGWLLVRASGTEPKIRITAEAKNKGRAQELYDTARNIIGDCHKTGRGAA